MGVISSIGVGHSEIAEEWRPREETVPGVLERTAEKFPNNDALVYPKRGLRYTYREFNGECDRLAKSLLKLGIKGGDRVAVWAFNVPEWVLLQFATAKIGAVLVTVNTSYKAKELEYLLKQSDSTSLFLVQEFKDVNYVDTLYSVVPELKNAEPGKLKSEKLPFLKNIVFIGEGKHPGMFSFREIMELGKGVSDKELAEARAKVKPHDVINMQYTSGTTGFPKGVMLTHYNIVNNARFTGKFQNFSEKDRLCIPIPFFHCFGCVLGTLGCVVVGATMVPIEIFKPDEVLEAVQAEKCTALYGVPTMFIMELNSPNFSKYDLSSLRTGVMAGSPCPIDTMHKAIDKMHMKEITIGYGLTEASPVITQTAIDDPIEARVETVGKAHSNQEVLIVKPGTNEELPRGEPGELIVRGYNIMKGYYKMPDKTTGTIDKQGFLHSADLASMDKDGYVRIHGRIDDMIIRGGENVYPREVEEFLYTNPKVKDVAVIGIPSGTFGEEVMAYIVLKEGQSATEEEIIKYCKENFSRYKAPRHVRFVEKFPMTASGKVQKFKLREIAIKGLGLEGM